MLIDANSGDYSQQPFFTCRPLRGHSGTLAQAKVLAVRRRRILEEGDPVAIDVAEDEPPRSSSAGFLCEWKPGFAHPPLMGVEVIYG